MKLNCLLALTIFLLTYSALDARAQSPQPTPSPNDRTLIVPRDGILINPNDRVVVTPNDGVILNSDRYKVLLTSAITGKIRWKKEYGLPSIDGGVG